ncbi:hypothetical protein [Clostridium sp. UBA5988]|uniref:hypothetical protein n=1 Tax=Clostridium sp. UBA5988 TaxID=1946369 RepID=UPI003216421C
MWNELGSPEIKISWKYFVCRINIFCILFYLEVDGYMLKSPREIIRETLKYID